MALLASFLYALLASSLAHNTKQSQQYTGVAILNPNMDDFIEKVISSWNSPGGAGVAVVKQHEDGSWQVETKGYGIANVAEQSKIDADSLFYIGSNSKLLAAIAGGLLVANESLSPRISWDTKIADVLPESIWKLQDPMASAETTITDAMSHRTGLPDHVSSYSRTDTVESVLKKARHLKPSAGFRSTWQYNSIMYSLLGYLPAATLPQKPALATYLKTHVFDPLGLTSATFSLATAKKSGKLADPTAREGINRTEDLFGKGITRVLRYPTWFQEDSEDGGFIAGAGGAIMSVKDVASWLQVLLLEGQNAQTGEQVIPQEVIRKVSSGISVVLAEPQYPEMSNVVYGGGLSRASYRGNDVIEHNGGLPGYFTRITRLPNSKLGVAVLTNDDNYGDFIMEIIKWRIIDEVLGLEPIDWDLRMRAMVKETYQSQISAGEARPSNPTPPPVPFEQLSGLYRNLGYGDFELCYVSAPPSDSESESCRKLREDQPVMLPDAVRKDIPTFLARWDRFWYSYVKLEYIDGALFSFQALESQPTNDTSKPYWTYNFEEVASAAEFAVEDGKIGFGMIGGFWSAGPGVEDPVGGSAMERSEVWFEKI
ncbi:hypothetical protein VNI00_018439 [Paramarasmius palmivorus]|uniref:Beta-lactamase-related domain-containing protein n=1 Tax=Paramarasmius palmivorus TaxID=297713 RepID=A0AAW0AY48_9AGAR